MNRESESNLYFLFDAAKARGQLNTAIAFSEMHENLFADNYREALRDFAPYLLKPRNFKEFQAWIFEFGILRHWGYFLETSISFSTCCEHLRRFVVTSGEDGKAVYFRFYDPRVLNAFLPNYSESQLSNFFGPIQRFISGNGQTNDLNMFSIKNGKLNRETQILNQFI